MMKRYGQRLSLIALFIVYCCLGNEAVHAFSACNCTVSTTTFANADALPTAATLSISTDSQIQNGKDIGNLVAIGDMIVLKDTSLLVYPSPTNKLKHSCPDGFEPLTKTEFETVLARTDLSTLFSSTDLDLLTRQFYFTSTKVYPDNTNTTEAQGYEFYGLNVLADTPYTLTAIDTKEAWDDYRKAICKMLPEKAAISFTGYAGYDLDEGQKYEIQIENKNVVKYQIEVSGGATFNTKKFEYTHSPTNDENCVNVSVRLQMFSGAIVGNCFSFYTKLRSKYGFQSDSTIAADSITSVNLSGVTAKVFQEFFFHPGSAPISPIEGDDSSSLVFYSDKTDSQLYVQKVSKVGAKIGNRISMGETGDPFDILATTFGFFVLARNIDTHKAWIALYKYDGTQTWKRIIMNNGNEPTVAADSQMIFFENAQCKIYFGLAATFDPENGRLSYGRGRVQAIFAHYNHFGLYENGDRNDHTGDTLVNLDAETGLNQKLHFSWGSSHSLTQQFLYDGQRLFVASLGDAYPQNVNFQVCDIDRTFVCTAKSTLIPGSIPGNGSGKSSGRLGGFIEIQDNRDEKFFVYKRMESSSDFDGPISTDVNEVSLMRFTNALVLVSQVAIFSGMDAKRINNLKSLPYGKNILLAYNKIPEANLELYNPQINTPATDSSHIILIAPDGSTVSGPFDIPFQISSFDNWRVLENGAVVFTYVDATTGQVSVRFFPNLTAVAGPAVATASDLIYGQASITASKPVPIRNNYNDKCCLTTSPNYSIYEYQILVNSTDTSNNGGSNTNNSTVTNTIDSSSSAQKLVFAVLFVLMMIIF